MATWRGPGLACFLAVIGLAGCSSLPAAVNPVNWWDSLTDRNLATERPPPPQADAPYPNLATVPDKPAPADAKAHQAIVAGLASDRANAQYEATQVPITDPSSPQASPALFGGSAPPPGAAAANAAPASAPAAAASLAAANAPPPAPNAAVKPAPAPRNAVSQAPLAPPATTPPPATTAPATTAPATTAPATTPPATTPPATTSSANASSASAAPPAAAQVAAVTPPPSMPDAPPPPPQVPGADIPPTKPVPPPVKPAPPPAGKPPLSADEAKPFTIAFPLGSAVIPPAEMDSIKGLAARRGSRSIAVIGYGDAKDATPETQTAAVTLALARARAVIAALTAAGVPMDVISMDAEANGHGALARLVE